MVFIQVLGRLEFARDLHAVDAVYHQSCSVIFRTMKMVPQAFSPKSDKQTKSEARGRPSNMNKAFLKDAEYLQDNDDETDHNFRSSVTTTKHIQLFI